MGPVRQNPIQRTVSLFICVCIALCTIVAHNIAQNRPDSFPLYPPDNHHCSDDVYLREGGKHNRSRQSERHKTQSKIENRQVVVALYNVWCGNRLGLCLQLYQLPAVQNLYYFNRCGINITHNSKT